MDWLWTGVLKMALRVQYYGSGTMVTEDQKDRFPFPKPRNYPGVRFDCSVYDMAKIPLGQFASNETYFHLLCLGYNLVNWWKRLCLPPEYHAMTLGTLRPRLFMLPAEFVGLSQGQILRFPPVLPEKQLSTGPGNGSPARAQELQDRSGAPRGLS